MKFETKYNSENYTCKISTGGHRNLTLINPNDKEYHDGQLWLVTIEMSEFLAYANHCEQALDTVINYCEEHAPGCLSTDIFNEVYNEAIGEGKDEQEAFETASIDMISGGNSGNWIGATYSGFCEIDRNELFFYVR